MSPMLEKIESRIETLNALARQLRRERLKQFLIEWGALIAGGAFIVGGFGLR